MASAVEWCAECRALVMVERLPAHLADHRATAAALTAFLPAPPSRAARISTAIGTVVAWVFLLGCLAMFLALVAKLVRWSVG